MYCFAQEFLIIIYILFCSIVSNYNLSLWRRHVNFLTFFRFALLHCYYSSDMSKINFAAKLCISAFWCKKQNWFIFIRAHSTTFWICKSRKSAKKASHCGHALLKINNCFHSYLLNGRRYPKHSNESKFSIKRSLNSVIFVKISFQISIHCKKN